MSFAWPSAEEALAALVGGPVPDDLQVGAARHGLELVRVGATYDEIGAAVRGAAPALLHGRTGWIAVARAGRWRVQLVTPAGRQWLPARTLARALTAKAREGALDARANEALALLPDRMARLESVRDAFAARWAADTRFELGHLVRPRPTEAVGRSFGELRVVRHAAVALALQLVRFGLLLATWGLVGRGALAGRLDGVAFAAWVGVLVTGLPLRGLLGSATGELGLGLGALLQQRLYAGVLAIDPDEVRQDGIGRMLGRAYQGLDWQRGVVSGLVGGMAAGVELALAGVALALGGGWGLVGLLAGWWIAAIGLGGVATWRIERALVRTRLDLTGGLVEAMTGQRSRLVQEPPERRFVAEDAALVAYAEALARRDRLSATLGALATHGWRAAAVIAVAPRVIGGVDVEPLALLVGGVLVGDAALGSWLTVARAVASAAASWDAVAHLHGAAARLLPPAPAPAPAPAVLRLRGVGFRYPGSERWVLRGVDWEVVPGTRVLIGGASGAGKSTLAAILAGLRPATEGTVLLDGLDLRSVGSRTWRRRVVCVPQFHQNHLIADTFALNVLLGHAWPPDREDVLHATQVCLDLGLGPLLEAMPGGLTQGIGDGGWQLSHGERARLFLARALVQRPAILVVDESFGALDPITLDGVLERLEQRAVALVVVAHP